MRLLRLDSTVTDLSYSRAHVRTGIGVRQLRKVAVAVCRMWAHWLYVGYCLGKVTNDHT